MADFLRLRYPLKLDLGQMTKDELCGMIDRLLADDRKDPSRFRPVVAIMHTKDPIDHNAVKTLLDRLETNRVAIATFAELEPKIRARYDRSLQPQTQRIVS
jgi:hypothetical protein